MRTIVVGVVVGVVAVPVPHHLEMNLVGVCADCLVVVVVGVDIHPNNVCLGIDMCQIDKLTTDQQYIDVPGSHHQEGP